MGLPSLQAVLQDIAAYLEELRQTLVKEYEALAAGDPGSMQATAETKQRLSAILEDLEQERLKQLRQAGLDLTRTGLMAYLGRHSQPDGHPLSQLWQRIETLTRDCERLNRVNGIIIAKQRQRAETALSILKGQVLQPQLYSSQGAAVSAPQSKPIAKA